MYQADGKALTPQGFERSENMKNIEVKVKCNVTVPGEKEPRKGERTVQGVAVDGIKDASTYLLERFKQAIADVKDGDKRPASLQLSRFVDKNGTMVEEKFDAQPEQLASDYIVTAINDKLYMEVYQPNYVSLRDELLGPEIQVEKLAKDMVERSSKISGRAPLTLDAARIKARAILLEA